MNEKTSKNDIAVIGMAGRFPGAKNLKEYWDNLKNGVESVSFFSDEELIDSGIDSELLKNPNYVKASAIIDGVENFDSEFFGYTHMDAEMMDPQVRIFHECAWHAFEDAGYSPSKTEGLVGVYAGASSNVFWEFLGNLQSADGSARFESGQLNDKDYLNSHISYKFNLKGPSISVFTACSTNLVAIHLACKDLINRECDTALSGGVSLSLPQVKGYMYEEGMIGSPDGHCRAFDAEAKGTILGNGVGCVILKRLDDAVADGDHIYAVIKGSAINNDGSQKVGYSAPSVEGQASVIRKAHQDAKVSPESITYIETHGTGTVIGDPIEIEGLKKAFNTTKRNYCAIGSVKTNIGHLDSAAGIASFIKTVLAIKNKQLPPSLHYTRSNPAIQFESSPFYVNNKLQDWKSNKPLRAGISSLGIGGTNAHIILEEAPITSREETHSKVSKPHKLVVLSAKSEEALAKQGKNLINYLKENDTCNLEDVCYTLQLGRERFKYRRTLVCSDVKDLIKGLEEENSRKSHRYYSKVDNKRAIFMFPGQGSQYINMGKELYQKEPAFRDELDHCLKLVEDEHHLKLKEILYPEVDSYESKELIKNTSLAQPLIFSFEYALAKTLIKFGIKPHSMIGYSFGEYVAACLAGVFTLEEALRLVVLRGKLMEELPPGAMLSVPVTEDEIKPFLTEDISLAVVNGSSCIVSGTTVAIDQLESLMKSKKYFCTKVPVTHASHSSLTDSILQTFGEEVKKIDLKVPTIPYLSNVTGDWITPEEATNHNYWISHLRETVRFGDGVEKLVQIKHGIFLEVGPGQDLSGIVRRYIESNGEENIIPFVRNRAIQISDTYYFYSKIGSLWLYGFPINWRNIWGTDQRTRVSLPTYPFEKNRYWKLMDNYLNGNMIKMLNEVGNQKKPIKDWFYSPQWKYQKHQVIHNFGDRSEKCLVFKGTSKFNDKLVKKLAANQETVSVEFSTSFEKISTHLYRINAYDKKDYEKLFLELDKDRLLPDKIIHSWSLGEVQDSSEQLYRGFYSLMYIVKAVHEHSITSKIKLEVITNDIHDITGDENLSSEKSILIGLCKVIPQEYVNIKCRCIDINITEQNDKLLEHLMIEMHSDITETMIAYRNNRRLIQTFEELSLPDKEYGGSTIFKDDGVYLIVGGLGNIGSVISRYIAQQVKAKIVLTGRTQLPDRQEWELITNKDIYDKIDKIKRLEDEGAEVLSISADVSELKQMKAAINEILLKYGKLDGVIYAAGITEGESLDTISRITNSQCELQFQAKMHGLRNLELVLEDLQLDFCVLFSSLASILGGLGFSAYASANVFVDTFVTQHNKKHDVRWLSIDWDAWESDGKQKDSYTTTLEQYTMSFEEGLEAFERLLTNNINGQVVISTGDLYTRIEQWINLETTQINDNNPSETLSIKGARPNLLNEYVAPRNSVEKKLVEIWERFFLIDGIGVLDNFFDLGGDSLKGITLIARIHKELNVKLPLDKIFNHPTIEGFAKFITKSKESTSDIIRIVEEKEYYDVSSAQRRMYLINQLDKESINYNITDTLIFKGEIDTDKLNKVLNILIKRHESLRTSFHVIEGKIKQKVNKHHHFKIEIQQRREKEIEKEIEDFVKPFDLSLAPLLRVKLIKLNSSETLIMIDTHHIISDGISTGVLIDEFLSLYKGDELPELKLQYKDYATWQREMMNSDRLIEQKEYWINKFNGTIPILDLPFDNSRPLVKSFNGNTIHFSISKELSDRLKELTRENGATLYMTLLAAYNLLLYKYTNNKEIIVGCPVAGRRHADLDRIIGMFVNTLPIKSKCEEDLSFHLFLQQVKKNALEAFENQDLQFEELLELLDVERDTSRNPLFETIFVLQNAVDTDVAIDQVFIEPYLSTNKVSKFDISLRAVEDGEHIVFDLEYNTDLFKKETIERMKLHFVRILEEIIYDSHKPIKDMLLLTENEKETILDKFNETDREYPRYLTIQELFHQQVKESPTKVAVRYKDQVLTYQELHEYSNKVARFLITKGVTRDMLVGVMHKNPLEAVISILGVLKAGGAYLPVDPKLPVDRKTFMLMDAGVKFVIGEFNVQESNHADYEVITLHDLELEKESIEDLENVNTSNDLAYVMYTSGSTGQPKGVMIEHMSVVRLVKNTNFIDFNSDDRILQTGAIGFDASTFEMWGALLNGLSLHLTDEEVILSAIKLKEAITENKITILWLSSPLFNQLVSQNEEIFAGLRYLLVGGDVLQHKHIHAVRKRNKQLKIINGYGPTENTTFSTCYTIEDDSHTNIPIGKPIANSKAYILDDSLQIQPIGVKGELFLAGDGLARGYLNNKELTEEKFILNPHVPGERMYSTGDFARWLPDGNIEFLGRIDNQVKIRGYRVEIGDIESNLLKHEKIKEALVEMREDKNGLGYLIGYLASVDEELTESQVKKYLSKIIPEYMIPSTFIMVEKLPLTPNGKIDRKVLSQLEETMIETEYDAPVDALEIKLVDIWKEVLQVKREIGVNEKFFEIGGHTLRVALVANKIHKVLHVEMPFSELFQRSTIKEIANYVRNADTSTYASIEKVEKREYYGLSSAQKRMYITNQLDVQSTNYNMPIVMKIKGKIEKNRLENTIRALIDRHESLRTSFHMREGETVQVVHEDIVFELDYETVEIGKVDEEIDAFIRPFDLSKAPLIRVKLLEQAIDDYILIVDMHHIISDGVSQEIIINDFSKLYANEWLPNLRIQYKDYAAWQQKSASLELIKKQENYWLNTFKGDIPRINLPIDLKRTELINDKGSTFHFFADKALTEKLKIIAHENDATLYTVLLAAYNVLLHKYSGQEDIIVGTPIAGRTHADTENIIGMFVNTLAIRNRITVSKTFSQFIRELNSKTVQAIENQDYQLEELIVSLERTRVKSKYRHPLFDVVFAYHTTTTDKGDLGDLNIAEYYYGGKDAKFDLTLHVFQAIDIVKFNLEYQIGLFKPETIQRFATHFLNILNEITENKDITIQEIRMFTDSEMMQIKTSIRETAVSEDDELYYTEFNF
ncbi:amino acid adenylation domain-containing protein [Virgibacillus pantothenticus]|uniref:non-ribosomal peptide synthetase/type I polyketide synthase n=1 Tax=Virgibacillus pantothenticus TaxID=1473 RepID=UPI001C22EC86|nr:non-ribosomal peptide synthetase/type I polyketide synthase [Virgibacillus pantothenticus]MBU8665451.1 amino acid adenylation domain-containing protein [Virgibacillus pantothenticus]